MVFYHDISLSNALILFNINHINEYKFYIHLCKISISAYIAWVLEITLLTIAALLFPVGELSIV